MAQLTHSVAANGRINSPDYKYLHKDHLGSITGITHGAGSQKGQLYRRMAFDPWGARRDLPGNKLSNNALSPSSILASYAKTTKFETNRGFTGHEMLDEVGIIHMNGRIYDASIGRFLQADPHVDGAASVGGFNRYAYGGNNPLNGTDPSGYGWLSKAWKKLKPFAGLIVGAIIIAASGGFASFIAGTHIFSASYLGAAAFGAITGAVGAAVNGGNILKGALFGGISGAAFFGVGEAFKVGGVAAHLGKKTFEGFAARVAAHGLVGGVLSDLQGGKFGHGFATAGIAKGFSLGAENLGANIYEQFATSTISGGTVSTVTGGKFANGAQSAAIAFALNAALSQADGTVAAQKVSAGTPGTGTAEDRAAFQKSLDALSTDGTLNPNRNFDSADAAATEVLNATAGLSKKYGLEVAGSIWKSKGGWRYTTPKIGGVGSASLTTSYIGYHTHPSGSLTFSNQFRSHTGGPGDAGWVASSNKSLYLGVQIGSNVSIGVCSPGSCPNFGRNGTAPSRVIQ